MKINSEYWISCILFPNCLTCCFLLVSLFPTWGWAFQCGCGSLLILQLISSLAVWISWLLWSGTKFKSRPRMRAFLIKKKLFATVSSDHQSCVFSWTPLATGGSHGDHWLGTLCGSILSSESRPVGYLLWTLIRQVLLLLRGSKLVPFNVVCYELYQVTHIYPCYGITPHLKEWF